MTNSSAPYEIDAQPVIPLFALTKSYCTKRPLCILLALVIGLLLATFTLEYEDEYEFPVLSTPFRFGR